MATFSHIFHLKMSEIISCVEIHTCMHAFICLILCVARSSVVSLQVINMWKYIQSAFVLVPFIQGIQIGFYAWTLVGCIYLIASSPCCTWKLINDNTQHPNLQQRNNIIQLLHLNEINMRFYGAEYNNIERGECRFQYCCTLLHKTSYWSSSSVVIVLLHTALFYS